MGIRVNRNIKIISYVFLLSIAAFSDIKAIDGYVIDSISLQPISFVKIQVKGSSIITYTDDLGYFFLDNKQIINVHEEIDLPVINVQDGIIEYTDRTAELISIYNIAGKCLHENKTGNLLFSMENEPSGIYVLTIIKDKKRYTTKFIYNSGKILINHGFLLENQNITLLVEKDGYTSTSKKVKVKGNYTLKLTYDVNYSNTDYIHVVENETVYNIFSGVPLILSYTGVSSLKFIYDISDEEIYYMNSKKHNSHYRFARDFLGYEKGLYLFDYEQYQNNPNRKYFLGSVDYFSSTDLFVIQIFPSDDINCDQIKILYDKIYASTYFKEKLFLIPNKYERSMCDQIPVISIDSIYAGQNYQCLNPEIAYGYIKKVDIDLIDNTFLGRHDIIVTNGIPIDLPVVAGIITTEFQTVLSHINVLSHNRGTPNMALRDAWDNDSILQFENKLVYLRSELTEYEIREATIEEAEVFWNSREPSTPIVLKPDLETQNFLTPSDLELDKVSTVGGKAANMGELKKINTSMGSIPLPEGIFAIPFYFYNQHIKKYGLDDFISIMLQDNKFKTDALFRKEYLKKLRDSIKDSPIDTLFYQLVNNKLSEYQFTNFRFRSSTNAEDIQGFNGAGLYDSKTGIYNSVERPVDEAIKKVWASLWNFRAFEERDYFKIDQESVAMGILVHQSFPDEQANGVVITKNLYNTWLDAFTINSQYKEISVVNPEEGYLPEQVLYYSFENAVEYINYSNVPEMPTETVLTGNDLNSLVFYCRAIVDHYQNIGYGEPLDIEFKILRDSQNQRQVLIKQCRFYND